MESFWRLMSLRPYRQITDRPVPVMEADWERKLWKKLKAVPRPTSERFSGVPVGPVLMTVSGALVSTFHVWVAGVASLFPAASIDVTVNVCEPSVRLLTSCGETQSTGAAPSIVH